MQQAATTIRNERLRRGKTLRDAANEVGIDHGHLRRIELGEIVPGPRIRLELAKWVGADVLEMWKDAS